MRLEQSFEVPVPVSQAWGVLLDVERIAPCMPGATLTGFDGTAFTGLVKVKLGPVSLSYKGRGSFVERDESARRVVITASGQDSRGAGGASAKVTAVLQSADGDATTQVNVVADLDISGRAAQFGRGIIADVSGRLVKQFADGLAETIGAGAAPAPAGAPAAAPAAAEPVAEAIPSPQIAEVPPPAPTPEPEYHPLALQEPEPPAEPSLAEPAPAAPAPAQPAAATPSQPARVEGKPIDLLAVSGAKGMARKAGPVLIVVALVVVALVVWLIVR